MSGIFEMFEYYSITKQLQIFDSLHVGENLAVISAPGQLTPGPVDGHHGHKHGVDETKEKA